MTMNKKKLACIECKIYEEFKCVFSNIKITDICNKKKNLRVKNQSLSLFELMKTDYVTLHATIKMMIDNVSRSKNNKVFENRD